MVKTDTRIDDDNFTSNSPPRTPPRTPPGSRTFKKKKQSPPSTKARKVILTHYKNKPITSTTKISQPSPPSPRWRSDIGWPRFFSSWFS